MIRACTRNHADKYLGMAASNRTIVLDSTAAATPKPSVRYQRFLSLADLQRFHSLLNNHRLTLCFHFGQVKVHYIAMPI